MRRFSCYAWIGIAAVVVAASQPAEARTIKAAVVRSGGTLFPGGMIWEELNQNWAKFGDTAVSINYRTLGGPYWDAESLKATGADVLILSAVGYLDYTDEQVQAVVDYVQSGHGVIITYESFLGNRKAFAPLVGMDPSLQLGTGTALHPFQFELLAPFHPIFRSLGGPYVSGVPYGSYAIIGTTWPVTDGQVLANKYTQLFPAELGILAKETPAYRGLYFSYFIENAGAGANFQDKQLFYNGLLWTAGVPEPATGFLLLSAVSLVASPGARRPLAIVVS